MDSYNYLVNKQYYGYRLSSLDGWKTENDNMKNPAGEGSRIPPIGYYGLDYVPTGMEPFRIRQKIKKVIGSCYC